MVRHPLALLALVVALAVVPASANSYLIDAEGALLPAPAIDHPQLAATRAMVDQADRLVAAAAASR